MELFFLQTLVFVALVSVFYKYSNGFKQNEIYVYCTLKTLPVLALSLFSYFGTSGFVTPRRFFMFNGQMFGAVGDWLLSAGNEDFILGSLSFGAGHIMYMTYFGAHLKAASPFIIALSTTYTFATIYFLIMPHFRRNTVLYWVLIGYSLVICCGAIVAGSLFFNGAADGSSGWDYFSLALGYLLFVLSDTCILLRITGKNNSDQLHEFILFTYYASQYLIYRSAIHTQNNLDYKL